jgi:hypothetical protein
VRAASPEQDPACLGSQFPLHKKLRSKRLTPVLIKEITRRCYLKEVWQAIYTAGIVLPTPVSTTRYYHRSIDWQKLNDVGFSPLPAGSKPQYQVMKYKLPDHTATKGLRQMEERDVDAVLELLKAYLAKFDMSPMYTREEIVHWLLHKGDDEQVVWSYVVEVLPLFWLHGPANNHRMLQPKRSLTSSRSTVSNPPSSTPSIPLSEPPTCSTTPPPSAYSLRRARPS